MWRPFATERESQPIVRWNEYGHVWSVYVVLPSTMKSTFQMWRRHCVDELMPDHHSALPWTVALRSTVDRTATRRAGVSATCGTGASGRTLICLTKVGSTGCAA